MFKMPIASMILIGTENRAFAEERFRSWDDACSAAKSVLAEGDLIFLDIPNVFFRRVASVTDTWTSHVGIAFKDEFGDWMVAESTVPLSKKTRLCKFLRKSSEYKFEIKRLNRPLTPVEVGKLLATASSMLNKFYSLGFDFDSKRFFCSKFVYLTYQTIGVEVGRLETFRQLLVSNPRASLTFWKLWFFGSIPWDRKTVIPASQLNDPKFISILRGT